MSRPRWNEEETSALVEIRASLKDELKSVAQNIEVVGDRSLLRFYRGHLGVMPTVLTMIRNYLNWRIENNVDEIRHNIVHGGLNCPEKFPHGQKILEVIPQMICDHNARDRDGVPISTMSTHFSVREFMDNISSEQYRTFIMHVCEFHNIILEQLANARERSNLEEDSTSAEPYGVVLQALNVRDMGGLGMEHCGPKGQEIAKIFTLIARDNYPELLKKMIVVNSPWVFNGLWWFLKALLPQRTIDKVSINGGYYAEELAKYVDASSLPESLGGTYTGNSSGIPFEFDTSEGGLLWISPDNETTETEA